MHQTKLRGQVATEFLLYTSFFIVITIAAFLIVNELQRSEIPLQQNKVVKETGETFVNIITLSVKGGEGFSYSYTFPRTIFGIPYQIDFTHLASSPDYNQYISIIWEGSYGEFIYDYYVPAYNYYPTGCIGGGMFTSNSSCSNVLTLINDGENLTITQ
ncbi:MAG: hypothetical protein ABH842_05290 [Candidatus Micrarchaeota archaeon]